MCTIHTYHKKIKNKSDKSASTWNTFLSSKYTTVYCIQEAIWNRSKLSPGPHKWRSCCRLEPLCGAAAHPDSQAFEPDECAVVVMGQRWDLADKFLWLWKIARANQTTRSVKWLISPNRLTPNLTLSLYLCSSCLFLWKSNLYDNTHLILQKNSTGSFNLPLF